MPDFKTFSGFDFSQDDKPIPPKSFGEFAPMLSRSINAGEQHVFKFENGFGASVIKTPFSYGGDEGRWELGMVKFSGEDYSLFYHELVNDDVLGWLTEEDVTSKLREIENYVP